VDGQLGSRSNGLTRNDHGQQENAFGTGSRRQERQTGKLAKAKNAKGHEGFQKTHVTLKKQGVDKNLADRARKTYAVLDRKGEGAEGDLSRRSQKSNFTHE
jgi:hypothetical protein